MKKKNRIKKKVIVICILLFCFCVYNIVWFQSVYKPYIPFCEAVGKDEDGDYYYVKDDISYYVNTPDYLRNTGNLAIGTAVIEDGKDVMNMIIWRKLDGTYKVGISIEEYEVDNDGTVHCESIKFEIDEQMKLLAANEEKQKVLEEYRNDIERYYDLAEDMWGILGS